MTPRTPTTFRFKVGLNRGRRRIWLDGPRLLAAGFSGGSTYTLSSRPGRMVLTLDEPGDRLPISEPPKGTRISARRVTGRPDGKPIVDISGADVDHAFPDATHIAVTFGDGEVTIKPASAT